MDKPRKNMRTNFTVFITAAVIFLAISAGANAPARFYNVNSIFGISFRETASVLTDEYGFIWVSSRTGILRLTDDDYRIYQLPYETWNVISVELEYQDSRLYASTNNGQVFIYNEIHDRFDLIVNLARELNNPFLTISNKLIDQRGRIWFASGTGLIRYGAGNIQIFDQFGVISYIKAHDQQRILLAASNQILMFDIENNHTDTLVPVLDPVNPVVINKLFFDNRGSDLWIGSESSGVYNYSLVSGSLREVKHIPRQPVLALEMITDTTIMAGIDGQGLWEIDMRELGIINVYKEDLGNPHSLRGNGVYDIFKAGDGRIWVCTYSGGVSYFDLGPDLVSQFVNIPNEINSLVNNDVNDILEDSRGNIWFATNNGLSRYQVETATWQVFYHNIQQRAQVFLTIEEDSHGNIWAGTFSSGVYVVSGKTGKEIAHFRDNGKTPFNNNFVFDIYNDKNGNIWIAGVMGELFRYEERTGRFFSYGNQPVYTLKKFSDDEMLLGCTYGLSILNTHSGEVEIILTGFLVHDFLVLGNSVWIASGGDGLVKFNIFTRQATRFNTEFGLPSNFVNSIVEDRGYLWLGTENGISKFNKANQTVENFPAIKTLSGVSFNRNAHHRVKNGDLIWGTNRGAVSFNPLNLVQHPPQGQIFFQDFRVLGKSLRDNIDFELHLPVNDLQMIELRPGQNSFSLEVLPLRMPVGPKFSWMLYGFENDWSRPADLRNLNYTNIPAGSYYLKVRMWDSSMLNLVDEREIKLIIHPPFWKTWWFALIVVAFILFSAFLTVKYYIGLIRQAHTEDKVRFFTNTAHDIRTSLTLIKAPVEELTAETGLTDAGKYYLTLAKDQVNRLIVSVTELMNFQKADLGKEKLNLADIDIVQLIASRLVIFEAVAAAKNVELKFREKAGRWVSAVDPNLMEKVVDNLISNAIKYSKSGGIVEVSFVSGEKNWELSVKDYGIGMSRHTQRQLFREFYRGENAIDYRIDGSGIGLLVAKKYIMLHGGKMYITSHIEKGTTFRITIPHHKVGAPLPIPCFEANRPKTLLPEIMQQHLSTVMIAEDNSEMRCFLKQVLQVDFKILEATDGQEAWEVIKDQLPDLVITDVMMPRLDGFELCRLIKSTYETSHIPVIMLTALSDQAGQLTGLGLGADDYLTKPFDTLLLRQRIKSQIANRMAVREKALKIIRRGDNEPILANNHNDMFLKKALKVVHNNISNVEFGKDLFASEMHVSASLLYKKIKALTNQSPTDFIKSVRLMSSLELLQKRGHSITEVSELCGFSSVGYFSTVFKKHFGKTPSEAMEVQQY